ncbi:MAG: SIMPL domain-containing protein [Epulopiscium sp.]|nr:SIMPL domain-containing protein [Candidatus Epulonipiscium sp.]
MKKLNQILPLTLIAILVFTMGVFSRETLKIEPVMANIGTNKTNTITATGEGVVKVKPDIANITMGVRIENKDARTAQTKNAEKMDQVIAALKKMGIADKDIQTSNYSIYPQYDWEAKGGSKIIGYTVENTIKITVRDITKVGDVLDIGVEEGANVSSGIQLSIADTEKYYQEALKQAVNNAKGKATAIGEAIGVTIKIPSSITEQSVGGRSVIYAEDLQMNVRKEMDRTPIQTGELDIRALVEVSYSY